MDPISRLSTIHVKSLIKGAEGTEGVQVAMLDDLDGVPAIDDWEPAEWGAPTPRGTPAMLKIGPESDVELAPGTYAMWVKVTGVASEPVFQAGTVDII